MAKRALSYILRDRRERGWPTLTWTKIFTEIMKDKAIGKESVEIRANAGDRNAGYGKSCRMLRLVIAMVT